jgi:outer membrane protein OmpA-like peptidoglycan-associated protein
MFRSLITGMVVAAFALGCSGPGTQLTQCQGEKEQLLATIREQRDANRSLHEHVASLESRLDESEKEIARGGKSGTRLSSTGTTSTGASSAGATKPRVEIADSKLAWKSPAKGTAASSGLAALAARDKRLALERAPGVGRLNVPIAFADNSATLTAADKRQLDDVAKLLKSKDATELQVLVSGFAEGKLGTSRAQAVADYLDSHGIAEERLAVAAAGSPRGGSNDATSSGVQILVAEKDAAVAGWGRGETIRR